MSLLMLRTLSRSSSRLQGLGFLSTLAYLPPALTPALLRSMDVTQVSELGKSLGLEVHTVSVLKKLGVKGRDLLAMDSGFLGRHGVLPGDEEVLQEAVALLRFGGPKTVRLILTPGAPAVTQTFASPQELGVFLSRQGAAGRCNSARVLTPRFRDLKAGEL